MKNTLHSIALVKQPAKVRSKFAAKPFQQASAAAGNVLLYNDSFSDLMVDSLSSQHHDNTMPFISTHEKEQCYNQTHKETNSDCFGGVSGGGVEITFVPPLSSLLSSCNNSNSNSNSGYIESMSYSGANTNDRFVPCPEGNPQFMDHAILQMKTIPLSDNDDFFSWEDKDTFFQ